MHILEIAGNTTRILLDSKLSNNESEKILIWRNTLLKQVKNYIDNNLNPAKVNVTRQRHICANISRKMKISVNKS